MSLKSWLSTAFVRHFPDTPPKRSAQLNFNGALNERLSFQAAVRMSGKEPLTVKAKVIAPVRWRTRVRRIGYVPVAHHNTPIEKKSQDIDCKGRIPGYVPDPLFDETSFKLSPHETHAFWIDLKPRSNTRPGKYTVDVILEPGKSREIVHKVRVKLHNITIKPRKNFSITHWFYIDALMDRYGTDNFDKRFWAILPKYMRNLTVHSLDTIYVPVFTPPLDGVKRPSQLMHVTRTGKNRYRLNWRDVRRYIRLAKKCGIKNFEWCHPFTQWGAKHAIRVYKDQGADEQLLWPASTTATSTTYKKFLQQYLPQLKDFLKREKILNRSLFHVSDEPHGEEHIRQYKKVRAMLRELAPWIRVMDALTDINFAKQGLTDMPVPSITTALNFVKAKIPCWCYYCCGPRGKYLNRLMDTPLTKIAMHGFLFYRWPFRGFLHWGYNYWQKQWTRELIDPFTVSDGGGYPGWAFGDTFVVYPGPDGPIDSMRWEVFSLALQDYALLQSAGIDPGNRILKPLKSFKDFPKDESWRERTRLKILLKKF
jgi:hypothetical protein